MSRHDLHPLLRRSASFCPKELDFCLTLWQNGIVSLPKGSKNVFIACERLTARVE
jgi:hypothetical protein